MQIKNKFQEGNEVYAKSVNDGQNKLYVEKAENGVYELREDKEKGEKVLSDKKFSEDDMSDKEWPKESKQTTNRG